MLTSTRINAATAGFRAVFLAAYEGASPSWAPLAFEVDSASASETYEMITGVPGMKEVIGEVKLEEFASTGFTIANKEWATTVPVKIADIERDKLGFYRPAFQEMADVARFHPQLLVAELLNNSFTAVDYTGTSFFHTAKPYDPKDKSKGAPTFSNRGTGVLNAANFVLARAALRKMKDSKGNNLNLGRKLVLVVPPALEETANKLRTAELLANETNTLRNTFEVVVMNELSSDTAWFLMEAGRAIKPLVVQYESRPQFIAGDDPRADYAIKEKKFIYQAYGRWAAGYALPQLAYGSTGTV